MEEEMVICSLCGKEVPERLIDRDGDCNSCRAESKSTDMTVGDLNSK